MNAGKIILLAFGIIGLLISVGLLVGGGALLWAVSAAEGTKLAEYPLDAVPVFDGIASANGRLYMTLENGHVLCLGPGA